MKRRHLCVYLEYLEDNEMKRTTELQRKSRKKFSSRTMALLLPIKTEQMLAMCFRASVI